MIARIESNDWTDAPIILYYNRTPWFFTQRAASVARRSISRLSASARAARLKSHDAASGEPCSPPLCDIADVSILNSHLVVRSLYLCCAACGHGAHPECLANFAAILAPPSARHSLDASPYDASYPSTPGIGTPLRAWLWGEDGPDEEEEPVEIAEADEKRRERVELLNSCPAGLCGHSPCILTLALEQM